MDPLSKYVVVRYWKHSIFHEWDIYKQQHLNTLEEAQEYISDIVNENDLWEFKIFELKEVQ